MKPQLSLLMALTILLLGANLALLPQLDYLDHHYSLSVVDHFTRQIINIAVIAALFILAALSDWFGRKIVWLLLLALSIALNLLLASMPFSYWGIIAGLLLPQLYLFYLVIMSATIYDHSQRIGELVLFYLLFAACLGLGFYLTDYFLTSKSFSFGYLQAGLNTINLLLVYWLVDQQPARPRSAVKEVFSWLNKRAMLVSAVILGLIIFLIYQKLGLLKIFSIKAKPVCLAEQIIV